MYEGARYCMNCGAEVITMSEVSQPTAPAPPQQSAYSPQYTPYQYTQYKTKSPGLALFLSLIFPGLGDIYAGRVGLGVIYIIANLTCVVVMPFLCVAVWIASMITAYTAADRYNRHLATYGRPPS